MVPDEMQPFGPAGNRALRSAANERGKEVWHWTH
jgi:hypothetical protein